MLAQHRRLPVEQIRHGPLSFEKHHNTAVAVGQQSGWILEMVGLCSNLTGMFLVYRVH